MRRALRECFGGLAIVVSTFLLASPAEASKFEFNGASDDGMVVWDGAFDVATFNSLCSAGPGTCDTSLFSLLNFTPTLTLTTSNAAAGNLTVDGLHVVAAIPIGSFSDAAVTTACSTFSAIVTCFANLDDLVANFLGPTSDSGDLQSLYTGDDPSETQAYLAVRTTPFSGSFASGATFGLDANGIAFFNAIAGVVPTANVGFNLAFQPFTIFNEETQTNDFVPFTIELTAGPVDTSVPEPSTWLLMLTGGAALAWRRRRARS